MVRRVGYRFRIYPTKEQIVFFEKHFGCCRFIYNYLLALKDRMYKDDKTNISELELKKEIPKLKKEKEYEWLKEVNSQSLQESALDLIKGFKRFFKKKSKKPRFKKKMNKQKFKVPQFFEIKESKKGSCFLKIPKLKSWIRVNDHRAIKGKIKQVTISKDPSGKYYVSLNCEIVKKEKRLEKSKNKSIGIDLGLTSFIVTSDGEKKGAPKFLRKSSKKLVVAQKSFSRKKEGSSNWQKQRKRVAVLHEKVFNQRKDFFHKTSFELVNENQVIYLEDLHVKGMMQNRRLGKSISDAGLSEFIRQLKYKVSWYNKKIVKIGRFEPSSKMCSKCYSINKDLKLSDRRWQCVSCLSMHDRDINAAKNILRIGQGMPESKSVEKITSVFSFKRKQVGSVKQEPVSKC